MESRGNDASYPNGGNNVFSSTLHWGVNWDQNKYKLTHTEFKHSESLNNKFHIYGLYWDEKSIYTYFDTPDNKVLNLDLSA